MDVLEQLHVMPHWDRSCRSNFQPRPVTVYWHRADQSQHWPYNARCLAGCPLECQFQSHWYDSNQTKSWRRQDLKPRSSALEADTSTTRPTRRWLLIYCASIIQSVSQGLLCLDSLTCHHSEIEAAYQTGQLILLQSDARLKRHTKLASSSYCSLMPDWSGIPNWPAHPTAVWCQIEAAYQTGQLILLQSDARLKRHTKLASSSYCSLMPDAWIKWSELGLVGWVSVYCHWVR